MDSSNFNTALNTLKEDPIMSFLIDQFGDQITLSDRQEADHAKALALLIVEQQVSFKAAYTIKQRFLKITNGLSYAQILALDNDYIQSVGLSRRKVEYIKNVYYHFQEQPRNYGTMNHEQISSSLIKIKGKFMSEKFIIIK